MKRLILLTAFASFALCAGAQVTSLHEDFNTCDTLDANGAHPSGWVTYNKTGAQLWKWYNKFGMSNSPCLGINGYEGSNFANEDWLITPKMNLAAFTTVYFNFYLKSRFYGPVLGVKYSTDYSGTGNPTSATWADLPLNRAVDTAKFPPYWAYSSNVTSIKSTPFFVAFIYTSTASADGGRLYDVDSVFTDTVAAKNVAVFDVNNAAEISMSVLGEATSQNMNIAFSSTMNTEMVLTLTDMAGRKVYEQNVNVKEGSNVVSVNNLFVAPGMYLVAIRNENSFGVTKASIK